MSRWTKKCIHLKVFFCLICFSSVSNMIVALLFQLCESSFYSLSNWLINLTQAISEIIYINIYIYKL